MGYCQSESGNIVKFKIQIDKNEPLIGATIYNLTANPQVSVTTDINGEASLLVKHNKSRIELSFLGPQVTFNLTQPVDSVFIDLRAKKATFYLKNKLFKRTKTITKKY